MKRLKYIGKTSSECTSRMVDKHIVEEKKEFNFFQTPFRKIFTQYEEDMTMFLSSMEKLFIFL